jgi:hypothetical protein
MSGSGRVGVNERDDAMRETKPTYKTMRERIEAEMEPEEIHAAVVAVLHAEASKKITTRLATKVAEALDKQFGAADRDIRVRREYGMTNLEYGGYARSGGYRGNSILIAHTIDSVPIGEKYLKDMDSALAAKRKRNADRVALLSTKAPERIDALLTTVKAAAATYEQIHDEDDRWSILPSRRSLFEEALGDARD